jgi:rRNA-processing protein CGR1
VTLERRKAAEERKRAEELKAQVQYPSLLFPQYELIPSIVSQLGARKAARLRRKAGRSKKVAH